MSNIATGKRTPQMRRPPLSSRDFLRLCRGWVSGAPKSPYKQNGGVAEYRTVVKRREAAANRTGHPCYMSAVSDGAANSAHTADLGAGRDSHRL